MAVTAQTFQFKDRVETQLISLSKACLNDGKEVTDKKKK